MKTLITFQRYDKNLKFYKGICSANYNNLNGKNIQILQVYRLVLTESFRSQQKKLQKYALFIIRKAGLMAPVVMHLTNSLWSIVN